MKNKVIQKTLTLATQDTDHINRSARRVILGMRKKLLNDPTRRIINALAALILGFALGLASLSGEAWAEGSEVVFGVTVPTTPVLQITLYDNNGNEITSGSSSTMSVTPQMANAAFNTSSISVNVGTSSLAGYNLTMYASDTSLKSGDNEIPTLGDGEFSCTAEQSATNDDACTFTENAWGYKLSTASAFGAIPAQAAPATLNSNDAPTNGITTTVNFGSRVNAQQPAGTYTTTINFIATANPISISNISQIEYLQDFANLLGSELSDVVNSMDEETNYTKKDARDNQDYTIAKLKDGKVWMTKNLNLAGGTKIYAETSQVPSGTEAEPYFTLPASSMGDFWENSSVDEVGEDPIDDSRPAVYNDGSDSYYSWLTATANSGAGINTENQDAPYSICPSGWKLPNTSTYTYANGSDFRILLGAYGGSNLTSYYSSSTTPTGATIINNIGPGSAPNFSHAGMISDEQFYYYNQDGRYWSSTSGKDFSSLGLSFGRQNINAASSDSRNTGNSVRCLLDTISFTIAGHKSNALRGMTLADWVNSSYSGSYTANFYVDHSGNLIAQYTSDAYCYISATPNTIIESGETYSTYDCQDDSDSSS